VPSRTTVEGSGTGGKNGSIGVIVKLTAKSRYDVLVAVPKNSPAAAEVDMPPLRE